jgi:carboxymethylenebutenolidase
MDFRRVFAAAITAAFVSACHRQAPMDDHTAHPPAQRVTTASNGEVNVPSAFVIVQPDQALPPSNQKAAARLAASPRKNEWVKLAWTPGSADSLMAFVVYPQNASAKSPVVVVVHEIYGLSTWVKSVADQLASQGFIAVAPDLVSKARGGPSTVTLDDTVASRLIRGVTIPERNAGIIAAASYAMSRPAAEKKYAVIGFCWGGQTTWAHGVHGGTNGFAGGVAFYGSFPFATPVQREGGGRMNMPIADSMAKIQVPVMLLNGSQDAGITAQMPAIDSIMNGLHKNYFGRNYPGAVHGFARAQDDPRGPGRGGEPRPRDTAEEQANVDALKDAWPRTVEFLKKNLGMR